MGKPSTRNLSALPGPKMLEKLCISLATLDAIVCRQWQDRYYSFNKDWNPPKRHRMASMRNGSGDDFHILFSPAGTAIKGFAHEYPMASPGHPPEGVLSRFPPNIEDFLSEPAFTMDCTTFCIWCLPDTPWEIGPVSLSDDDDLDGSDFLLALLDGNSQTYRRFVRDYFETEIPADVVDAVYSHTPLSAPLVAAINGDTSLGEIAEDLKEIGYPTVEDTESR